MLNRWIEPELLDSGRRRHRLHRVSPLAQGMLTDRYLAGIRTDSRAAPAGAALDTERLKRDVAKVRALNAIAGSRGQTLAQLAVAWGLRDQSSRRP